MRTITKGYFTFKSGDTYLILDSNKNEVGKIDVCDAHLLVTINDEETRLEELEIQPWFDKHPEYMITKDSPRWVEYNPNPNHNTKANDCTIRAYCAAEKLEWDDAYDIACKYGKNLAFMPNDNTAVKRIVEEEFGYTRHKLSKEERGTTVNDFAIKHNEGTFLVEVARHLVAVINGEYYDSWDSGKKKIRGYYTK